MQIQRGSRCTALFILNLGARWGWVVNATTQPLNPQGRAPVPVIEEAGFDPGLSGREWGRENLLLPPGFEPHTVQPVASRYTGRRH